MIKKFKFHLLGFPNYRIGWTHAPNNPFNTKLIYFAKMMKELGHEVVSYSVEGSEVPYVDENVSVVSNKTFEVLYGNRDKNALDHLSEETGPAWDEFNLNAIREIQKRIKTPGKDFLINFIGYAQKRITDNFLDAMICVEPGIGHNGSYLPNKIFESYAWQNHVYGRTVQPQQSYFPSSYDTVIPAYFDPDDYPFEKNKSDYYLYVGRITWGKGVTVAVDITRELGAELIVIGGGDVKSIIPQGQNTDISHVSYKGVLSLKDKVKYLANARALIYYSLYVEPFGHAPVEAMMCGTPIITSDFGAFSETNIHGLTGYRVSTFEEIYWAAKHVHKLDPFKIRDYAVNNYGLEVNKKKFQEVFNKLHNLRDNHDWYYLDKNNPLYMEHLTRYIPC